MTGCLLTQQAESPIQREELSSKTHNRSQLSPGKFLTTRSLLWSPTA